jgi:hypothetical protein
MAGGYIYMLGSHTGTLCIGVASNLYLRLIQCMTRCTVTIKCVPPEDPPRALVAEKPRTAWVR